MDPVSYHQYAPSESEQSEDSLALVPYDQESKALVPVDKDSLALVPVSVGPTYQPRWTFDVFLSFRGEDTRKSFVDHLYNALKEKGVYTFKDDKKLERGATIRPELIKGIEESRFAVVVLSPAYADSSWCLDELQTIAECQTLERIFPVFHDIDPSDVRKQKGTYEKAFKKHEETFKGEPEKLARWRRALITIADRSGWDTRVAASGHESQCIKEIVGNIFGQLGGHDAGVVENLVGVESHVQNLKSLLDIGSDDVRFIGIWGMGGIGKTTVARAVFDQIVNQFESYSFVTNIRDVSKNGGLPSLQEKLLSGILKETSLGIKDPIDGAHMIMRRLRYKMVLIVLDDVDHIDQLQKLAGSRDWFGKGSRIIVTTRNQHLMSECGVDKIYEVGLLSPEKSVQLFSMFAFKTIRPPSEYVQFCDDVIRYARGLPLALRVLGSCLSGRDISEWRSAMKRLERIPETEVTEQLKLSFDVLKESEKEIFLDIACFFKEKKRDSVVRVLESFGYHPDIDLSVLIQQSLVFVSNGRLQMHNLILDMGRHIARQSHKDPAKRSRVWSPDEVCELLSKREGKAVERLILDWSEPKEVDFSSKAFTKMEKLKLLKINNAIFTRGPDFLPGELIWLDWDKYPSKSLPESFLGEKLVGLKLRQSNIAHLWADTISQFFARKKCLNNLKFLNLSGSKKLIKTPDFKEMPNLERLILDNCKSLVDIHPSLGVLKSLVFLSIANCVNLKSLPSPVHFSDLNELVLWGCPKLESFPDISGEMSALSELHLEGSAIKELPSKSVKHLTGLGLINLSNCTNLVSLPKTICELQYLKTLDVSGCSKLEKLPKDLGNVKSLEELLLDGTSIMEIPASVANLEKLRILSLGKSSLGARSKRSLFKFDLLKKSQQSLASALPSSVTSFLPPKLQSKLSDPQRVPEGLKLPSFSRLYSLTKLNLSYCNLSREIPGDLSHLSWLEELDLSGNNFVQSPASISELSQLKTLILADCTLLEELPELPCSIAVLNADCCSSLKALPDLTPRHDSLWKVSLVECFKLEANQEDGNIADLLLQLMIQGTSIVNHRFSILLPGTEIPGRFVDQKTGNSASTELASQWSTRIMGFAVAAVSDRIVTGSKIGVTFTLKCNGQQEEASTELQLVSYDPSQVPTKSNLLSAYETELMSDSAGHLWMGCISFYLFRLLFPQLKLEDWANIEGRLVVEVREELWFKPIKCGVRVVMKDEVRRAMMRYISSAVGKSGLLTSNFADRTNETQENITAITTGVGRLNWFTEHNEEIPQFGTLVDSNLQKTIWFDY